MMGTDYSSMMGSNGGTMMFLGWVAYVLVVALIVLAIMALWKYLNK
ncbi:MAG: hypothetical protein Q7S80_00440 [bacterium]|nr:hypothetical protein [bacterium]